MQTGYISFCDTIGFNIKSDKIKKQILNTITNLSNIKIIQKHFDIFNKNHFKKLNEIPHLVSLKTNGNPYLLFLTQINFINLSIFIDKKIQPGYFLPRMIITYFQFDDSLYNNTLFEGEMIKNKNKNWLFLINDIYIHKNISLINQNIFNRLDIVNNILNNDFNIDDNDICRFNIKKYFKYNDLKYVVDEFSKKLNYTSRGIYFVPLYFKFKNILYNFDDTLVNSVQKIKYQKDNEFLLMKDKNNITHLNLETSNPNTISNKIINSTISNNLQTSIFHIEKTDMPDVFNLYDYNTFSKVDIAYIPNIKTSKFMREIFKNVTIITKLKVKCQLINKNNKDKWQPIELVN